MGADGGIGGTYAVMPELYLKIKELTDAGKVKEAREIQYAADAIIYAMCECHGNLLCGYERNPCVSVKT